MTQETSSEIFDQDTKNGSPIEDGSSNHREGAFRRLRRTRGFAAGVGAIIGALGVIGGQVAYETAHWDNKLSHYQDNEQTLVGKWQSRGVPMAMASLLLEPGVTYRSTPDMINHSKTPIPWLNGNVDGQVAKGQVEVIKDPILLTTPSGVSWIRFEQGNGSKDNSTDAVSAAKIADHLEWVNFSELQSQQAHSKTHLFEFILKSVNGKTQTVDTQTGSIAANGQFLDNKSVPAAYAVNASASQYQEFKNFFLG